MTLFYAIANRILQSLLFFVEDHLVRNACGHDGFEQRG